jgi:hypothetical protein
LPAEAAIQLSLQKQQCSFISRQQCSFAAEAATATQLAAAAEGQFTVYIY